jgi:hypothetical protein
MAGTDTHGINLEIRGRKADNGRKQDMQGTSGKTAEAGNSGYRRQDFPGS